VNILDALFRSSSLEQVFSDAARVQAILHFEAALSRAQATVGIMPEANARAIAGKCRVENFDLDSIAQGAAHAGNLAIPIVKMLTEAVAKDDKDAARFVHWGATSQDAIDTGVVLQLRRGLELFEQDLVRLSSTLSGLAEKHRGTPMVARTWMQHALPTTFGFVVAGWLNAILRHRVRLTELGRRVLTLQFGGAVGTLAALGSNGATVAKALAHELKLELPAAPWHAHRDRIAEVATTLGLCMGTLGKIARDISLHTQTELAELFEPSGEGRGGSSTMPHKRRKKSAGWGVGTPNGKRCRNLSASLAAHCITLQTCCQAWKSTRIACERIWASREGSSSRKLSAWLLAIAWVKCLRTCWWKPRAKKHERRSAT
jgi:3-carboxy-cis,cis-muconate cycloisomerase